MKEETHLLKWEHPQKYNKLMLIKIKIIYRQYKIWIGSVNYNQHKLKEYVMIV